MLTDGTGVACEWNEDASFTWAVPTTYVGSQYKLQLVLMLPPTMKAATAAAATAAAAAPAAVAPASTASIGGPATSTHVAAAPATDADASVSAVPSDTVGRERGQLSNRD